MKQLAIMHTESHRQWGGQERRVYHECRWMSEKGHRIIVAVPPGSPVYEKAVGEGWEVYGIPFKKSTMPVDMIRIRSLIAKIRPNVFNTHGNTDTKVGLAASWNMGIPCVIRTRHSNVPVGNSWYNRILYRDLSHYVLTTASRTADQLVEDLGVPGDRIFTIASGIIPPSDLPERETARKNLADELGLESDARFVGCVSRLSEGKGLEFLIQAFARIRDKIPGHHLVLVGDGGFEQELRKVANENGISEKVGFTGYKPNPWPCFRAFDCKVLASSKYEGIPQVLLEAMFASCPVIGSNTGGIPDVVVHGETGLLVGPDDAGQLSEAVLEAITNRKEAEKRAGKAFRFVVSNHTIDTMGERILDIYRNSGAFAK